MKIRHMLLAFLLLVCLTTAALAEGVTPLLLNRTTLHGTTNLYDTTPLSTDLISSLLHAAFTAPSGGNQLCLNYFVVDERSRMEVIAQGHPYSTALATTPLLIIVAGDEANCRYPELIEMDAGLAAMAMLTEATAHGMSSCVMSIWPQEERVNAVRSAVEMPETMKPVLMVSFGYPAVDVTASASVLGYDEAKVHMNTYQGNISSAKGPDSLSSATSVVADTANAASGLLSILTEGKTNWNFTDEAVDPDDLAIILEAGLNTASAVNEQPWQVNVITDPEMIRELADTESSGKAPVLLLVSVTNSNEMKILDAGLITQSMQIAARALGYATKIETASARKVRNDTEGKWAMLGIPESKSARAGLFIGHADEAADAVSSPSTRVPAEDILVYNP